jgi:hypothetical protein
MNADLVAQRAIARMTKEGADALNEMEKTVATAWLFAAGVGNSGFTGYFNSTRGDLAYYAPEALTAIGAPQLAELAAKANAVFGAKGPPRNRLIRREFVRALTPELRRRLAELEQQYYSSEEDIDELLEKYVTQEAHVHG